MDGWWLNYGDRSFVDNGAAVWNTLPVELRLRVTFVTICVSEVAENISPDIVVYATADNRHDTFAAHIGILALFGIKLGRLGPMHELARQFLVDLGRKSRACSGDDREGSFLFQRISVLLDRFKSVLLHDSFVTVHCPD